MFPQQDFPDLVALGPKKAFGYFCTTWHYTLNEPGVEGADRALPQALGDAPIPCPTTSRATATSPRGSCSRAIERAGTTRNHDVIKALEGHVIKDNFRKYPSVIREWDHLVGQMIFLARTKKPSDMKDKYDLIELIADVPPEQASPPRELSKCKMQSFADTPVYGG